MGKLDRDQAYSRLGEAVNMTPAEHAAWLETEQSRGVGQKQDGGEGIGHAAGRRIAAIRRKRRAELSDEDYALMRKAAGYVARHRAQRPENVVTSRWRYSLLNWGHDPLKDETI